MTYHLYIFYISIVYFTIALCWWITRKTLDWSLGKFLIPISAPPLWFYLFYAVSNSFLNRGKGIANLDFEPKILSISIAFMYLAACFLVKRIFKTHILFLLMLAIILFLIFIFPPLPTDI